MIKVAVFGIVASLIAMKIKTIRPETVSYTHLTLPTIA